MGQGRSRLAGGLTAIRGRSNSHRGRHRDYPREPGCRHPPPGWAGGGRARSLGRLRLAGRRSSRRVCQAPDPGRPGAASSARDRCGGRAAARSGRFLQECRRRTPARPNAGGQNGGGGWPGPTAAFLDRGRAERPTHIGIANPAGWSGSRKRESSRLGWRSESHLLWVSHLWWGWRGEVEVSGRLECVLAGWRLGQPLSWAEMRCPAVQAR